MTHDTRDHRRETEDRGRARAAYFKQAVRDKLIDHKHYICNHGDGMPEIAGWRWGQQGKAGGAGARDTAADNV
jgi:xylulose-5-phosphate/fructose-6-phosphate phosphoketolase